KPSPLTTLRASSTACCGTRSPRSPLSGRTTRATSQFPVLPESAGGTLAAMIRVGVFGAGGRMGSTVCTAVHEASDMELVAAVDPHHAGIDLHQLGVHGTQIQVAAKASALQDAGAEVVVDFTVLDAARGNLRW